MPLVATNCPHVSSLGDLAIVEDVISGNESFDKCVECDNKGPNLWLCLYPECQYVGCPEQHRDHSTIHNKDYPMHSAHMNLSSNRIWCYSCQKEIHTVHVPPPSISPNQLDFNKYAGDASVNVDVKNEHYDFHQRFVKK